MLLMIAPSKLSVLRSRAKALLSEMDSVMGQQASLPINFYQEVEFFEISLIRWALTEAGDNQCRAAKLLGLNPQTLNTIIKRYGLNHNNLEASRSDSFIERVAYRKRSR